MTDPDPNEHGSLCCLSLGLNHPDRNVTDWPIVNQKVG